MSNDQIPPVTVNRTPPKVVALYTPPDTRPGTTLSAEGEIEPLSGGVVTQSSRSKLASKDINVLTQESNDLPCMACKIGSRTLQHAAWCHLKKERY